MILDNYWLVSLGAIQYCEFLTATSRYFGVDIEAIRVYAKTFDDIEHLRAEIRLVGEKTIFSYSEALIVSHY